METTPCRVLIYADPRGPEPFAEWIPGLASSAIRGHVAARIHRLELGNFGDCDPVGGGVFELLFRRGPGYRVYFGRAGKNVVLLLCGGTKGTQQGDIANAKRYWTEFKGRK